MLEYGAQPALAIALRQNGGMGGDACQDRTICSRRTPGGSGWGSGDPSHTASFAPSNEPDDDRHDERDDERHGIRHHAGYVKKDDGEPR